MLSWIRLKKRLLDPNVLISLSYASVFTSERTCPVFRGRLGTWHQNGPCSKLPLWKQLQGSVARGWSWFVMMETQEPGGGPWWESPPKPSWKSESRLSTEALAGKKSYTCGICRGKKPRVGGILMRLWRMNMKNSAQVILSKGRQTLTSSADVVGLWKQNFNFVTQLVTLLHMIGSWHTASAFMKHLKQPTFLET